MRLGLYQREAFAGTSARHRRRSRQGRWPRPSCTCIRMTSRRPSIAWSRPEPVR
jgi:hypothetical protein